MNSIVVPHLPIKEFNVSEFENELQTAEEPKESEEPVVSVHIDSDNRDGNFKYISLILAGMGMRKYLKTFQKHNVCLETFLHLTEEDLIELNIDEKDREVLLSTLKVHRRSTKKYIVDENHLDDLKIAKNIHNQMSVLQSYSAYVELKMKKNKLQDYMLYNKETASLYLKTFTQAALVQAELISKSLYNNSNSHHLIGKCLKANNMKLPKHLEAKLRGKKAKKKYIFLKIAIVIGFTSMAVLIVKHFVRKS